MCKSVLCSSPPGSRHTLYDWLVVFMVVAVVMVKVMMIVMVQEIAQYL